MRGEFIRVWSESWRAIWLPLADSDDAPADLFCELYRELAAAFTTPPSAQVLADVIDDMQQSRQSFEQSKPAQFANEKALVRFFETAYGVLDELQGVELSNLYFGLLSDFIDKYSLGYSLRRPCALSPSLPGMFADLASSLKQLTSTDEHLSGLHHAHEEAIRDLRYGATQERIKTCISRQFMLMEAIASRTEAVTAQTLGDMCNQLASWPHVTIKESLKRLYGFSSDYPGIRHAGNPAGQLRAIETKDLAALSILLMGYMPYLTSALETNLASLLSENP